MSIQSTVNQGLSLVGLLMSQSPMAAANRQKAREDVATAAAKERRDIAAAEAEQHYQALIREAEEGNATYADPTKDPDRAQLQVQAYEMMGEAARQRFLTNPTAETYEDWAENWGLGAMETRGDYERAMKRREEKARQTVESQRISREITRPFDPTTDKFNW